MKVDFSFNHREYYSKNLRWNLFKLSPLTLEFQAAGQTAASEFYFGGEVFVINEAEKPCGKYILQFLTTFLILN